MMTTVPALYIRGADHGRLPAVVGPAIGNLLGVGKVVRQPVVFGGPAMRGMAEKIIGADRAALDLFAEPTI
jgi:hypothetical protein